MTIIEYVQAIKDGKVQFNWNGHNFAHDRAIEYKPEDYAQYGTTIRAKDIEYFVSRIDRRIKCTLEQAENYKPPERHHGDKQQTPEEKESMIKLYKRNAELIKTEHIQFPDWMFGGLVNDVEYHCFSCGEPHLRYVAKSETEIEVMSLDFRNETRNIDLPLKAQQECIFKNGVAPIEVEINVPTGKLVFVNFFTNKEEFEPPDTPYFDGKNINADNINYNIGRINLAKWYAEKHNIGYGQMGNMSIGVWQGKAKSRKGSIVIGSPYDPCECDTKYKSNDKDNAFHALKKTHKLVDSICCDMWRWMCIDASLIDDKYCHPYDTDPIILDVPPGRYKIIHMFRSDTEHDEVVYSTIDRIGDCK